MKRTMLGILFALMLAAIPGDALPAWNNPPEIIQEDRHFLVLGDGESYMYEYAIFDAAGHTVRNERIEQMTPIMSYVSRNIIEIRIPGSTYASYCVYYDTETNVFSDEFGNPFLIFGRKIAYYGDQSLVIQDIFDRSLFFREFPIDMLPTGPPDDIELLDGGKKLKMTYMRASDNEDETRIFDLE